MKDLVSIIIPTYNRGHYVLEALNSIKQQTYTNFECLIIDDGSTDDTESLVTEYCLKNNRFRYYRRPSDIAKGVNYARNYGLGLSKGQYVGFCDDDDLWIVQKLEKQLDVFSRFPDYGLVTGNIEFINSKGERSGRLIKQLHKNGNVFSEFLLKNRMSMITPLIKREVFETVGNFDASYNLYEDWEFWRRATYCYKVYAIQETLAYVRRHDDNTYKINSIGPIKEYKLYRRLNKSLKEWGVDRFSDSDVALIDAKRIKRYKRIVMNQCPNILSKIWFVTFVLLQDFSDGISLLKSKLKDKSTSKKAINDGH